VIAISGPANFSRKYYKQEEPPDDTTESGRLIEPVPAREQEGLGRSGDPRIEGA
jgi:hypothetical protein